MPLNSVVNAYYPEVSLGSVSSGTISWNVDAAKVAAVTINGSCTVANPTGQVAGAFYSLEVNCASSTASLAWGSAYKFPSGTAPTVTSTTGSVDIYTFRSDGTNMQLVGQSNDVR